MWYPAVPQLRPRAQQRENMPQRQHNSGGARVEHGWSTGGEGSMGLERESAPIDLEAVCEATSAHGVPEDCLRHRAPANVSCTRAVGTSASGPPSSGREEQGVVEEQAKARRAGEGRVDEQAKGRHEEQLQGQVVEGQLQEQLQGQLHGQLQARLPGQLGARQLFQLTASRTTHRLVQLIALWSSSPRAAHRARAALIGLEQLLDLVPFAAALERRGERTQDGAHAPRHTKRTRTGRPAAPALARSIVKCCSVLSPSSLALAPLSSPSPLPPPPPPRPHSLSLSTSGKWTRTRTTIPPWIQLIQWILWILLEIL